MCACKVASVVLLLATLSTVACQSLLSMGFCKKEYWSGFTCPPPGTLLDPGIDPASQCLLHCQVGSLPLVPPGKTIYIYTYIYI